MYNLGSMIIAWLSLPLELLCLLVLKLIKSYLYKGQYLYDKYRQKLMWRQPITIFTGRNGRNGRNGRDGRDGRRDGRNAELTCSRASGL